MNSPLTSKQIESAIKNLSTNKYPGQNGFYGKLN